MHSAQRGKSRHHQRPVPPGDVETVLTRWLMKAPGSIPSLSIRRGSGAPPDPGGDRRLRPGGSFTCRATPRHPGARYPAPDRRGVFPRYAPTHRNVSPDAAHRGHRAARQIIPATRRSSRPPPRPPPHRPRSRGETALLFHQEFRYHSWATIIDITSLVPVQMRRGAHRGRFARWGRWWCSRFPRRPAWRCGRPSGTTR